MQTHFLSILSPDSQLSLCNYTFFYPAGTLQATCDLSGGKIFERPVLRDSGSQAQGVSGK